MENRIFNEKNGLWYELQEDYYLPCLTLPEQEEVEIGVWGQRRRQYLKQHHRVLYYNLLTSGKLNFHLAEIDKQAEEMFSRLVDQLAEQEGVTEKLKAENQMLWVQRMNNICNRVKEIVNAEVIYALFLPGAVCKDCTRFSFLIGSLCVHYFTAQLFG